MVMMKREYRFTISLREAEAIINGDSDNEISEDARLLLKLMVKKAKEAGVGLDEVVVEV